jgi:hypothetical protein
MHRPHSEQAKVICHLMPVSGLIDEDGAYCSLVRYASSVKAFVIGGEMTLTVEAEVRYLNDEWRQRAGLASIGSRESRRANTRKHNVFIRDARAKRDELSLDVNGFTLVDHVSAVANFGDEDSVKSLYYTEIERLTREVSGANEVFITNHVVRTEDKSNFNSAYARFLHCDYSLKDPRSASLKTLESRHLDPADYETADFAWYNSWQPFDNEAQSNTLAVIDATTIAENDIVDYYYTGNNASNKSRCPCLVQGTSCGISTECRPTRFSSLNNSIHAMAMLKHVLTRRSMTLLPPTMCLHVEASKYDC